MLNFVPPITDREGSSERIIMTFGFVLFLIDFVLNNIGISINYGPTPALTTFKIAKHLVKGWNESLTSSITRKGAEVCPHSTFRVSPREAICKAILLGRILGRQSQK